MSLFPSRLYLANWYSFRATILPLGPSLVITGSNGQGKSVIQDAMNIIGFCQQLGFLNISGDKTRSAEGDAHWTVNGTALRKGDVDSYIILEIADDASDLVFHQGVRIRVSSSGDMKKLWFSGHGPLESAGVRNEVPAEETGVQMEEVYDTDEHAFRAFFTQRGYRNSFLSRPNALKDFRTMNTKLIKNEKLGGSLSEFAMRYLLPSPTVKDAYEKQKENFESLEKIKTELANYTAQKVYLENVCTAYQAYAPAARTLKMTEDLFSNIVYESNERRLTAAQEDYQKKTAELESLSEQQEKAEEEQQKLNNELFTLRQKDTAIPQAEEALQRAAEAHERTLQDVETNQICDDGIRSFLASYGGSSFTRDISVLNELCEKRSAEYHREQARINAEKVEKEKEYDHAEKMYQQYRAGLASAKLNGPLADAIALRDAINDFFAEEWVHAEASLFCDCVESVKDPVWQMGIETLIGKDRFGIVVPPEYYKDAVRIQHDMDNHYAVTVLDTRKKADSPEGDMVSQLSFTNEDARNWAVRVYGRYYLAEDEKEYLANPYTLRKNGQYKSPTRSIKNGTSRKEISLWFGRNVREQEAERWQTKAEELRTDIRKMEETLTGLNQSVTGISRALGTVQAGIRNYIEGAEEKEKACRTSLEQAAEKLKLLREDENEIALQKALSELQEKIAADKKALNELIERAGVVKNDIQAIEYRQTRYQTAMENYRPERKREDMSEEETAILDDKVLHFDDIGSLKADIEKLSEDVDRKKHNLNSVYNAIPPYVKDTLLDIPERIENEKDYRYFKDRLDGMDIDLPDRDRDKLDELADRIRSRTADVLRTMGENYLDAKQMRIDYNKNIVQYDLAGKQYCLSEIKDQNIGSKFILDYAKDLATGDHAVTPDQIDSVNHVLQKAIDDGRDGMKLFDYRNYVSVNIVRKMKDEPDSTWKVADELQKTDSTGQQDSLRYFLRIGVIDYQVFNKNSLRLIMLDEASKSSDELNSAYVVKMMDALHMSYLITTFRKEFANFSQAAYICEMHDKKNIHVLPFKKAESVQESDLADFIA